MDTNMFEQMTDEEIKEYLEEQEADMILNSLGYQDVVKVYNYIYKWYA